MAEDSAIRRMDIISDEAIKAPLEAIPALEKLDKELDEVIDTCQALQDTMADTSSSKVLGEAIGKLVAQNKNLVKTQDDLFKRVDKLEKENKALQQSLKNLTEETKRNREETKKLSDAMEGLDNRVGGNINRLRQLGKELLAIAKHPIVLTLAVIIGLLYAASSAVKTFWASTGEGEDVLQRQGSVWKQFFSALKEEWIDLGKTIQSAMGDSGESIGMVNKLITVLQAAFPFLGSVLESIRTKFNKTAKEAVDLTNRLDELADRQIANITKRAETERRLNQLTLESQDDLLHSDIDRLVQFQRFTELKKKQLEVDIDIAKNVAESTLLNIGLAHNLTKAEVERMTVKERNTKFTEEENRKIAQGYADVINLEAAYFIEVKKNEAKIVRLRKEMRDKEVEIAKKATQDILKIGEDAVKERDLVLRSQIADVERQATDALKNEKLHWTKREKIIKDSEELIKQMREQARIEDLQNQIKVLETSLKLLEFDADEQAKIAERLAELKLKLADEVYEHSKNLGKTQLDEDRERIGKIKTIYEEFASSIGNLFQSITDNRIDNLDLEERKAQELYDKQLKAAGDNNEAKKALEEDFEERQKQFEKRRIDALRRAAIFEKATAIIQAGINTALAVTKALPNIPLAIATGAAGAIQILAIQSKQLPQYAKGTKATSQPVVVAGEEGSEWYRTPQGVEGFTPDKATVMQLPVGTEIKSHRDSINLMARRAMRSDFLGTRKDAFLATELGTKIDNLNYTIRSKPVVQVNYTSRGVEGLLIKAMKRIKLNGTLFR